MNHARRPVWRPASGRLACTTIAVIIIALVPPLCSVAVAAGWPPAPALTAAPDAHIKPLPESVRATAAAPGRWKCTFSFRPPEMAQSVALAGSFNGWSRDASPLKKPVETGGAWTIDMTLGAGRYEYKFVVDGDRWHQDPLNPDGAPDGHSGQNSLLRLGRLAALESSDATLADGRIDALGLEHDPAIPLYAQADGPSKLLIRYRTLAHDLQRVSFVARDGAAAELFLIDEGPLFAMWEGNATLSGEQAAAKITATPVAAEAPREIEYTFVLSDGKTRASDPTVYTKKLTPDSVFHTPDWAKHAVWYQIMIDRFRNGDPLNDQSPVRPWTSEWFTPSPWEGKDGQTFYKHFVFDRYYGGDLAGLEEKLPYLKGLGVNALYLNPVFKAESHHKYNATSYIHIDDHFGTKGDYAAAAAREDTLDSKTWTWTESDKRFLSFIKKAKSQGFRVIIDGVFNHVGIAHPAFQDVKKNLDKSPYADWFDVAVWKPFKYYGWGGYDALPAFKKSRDGLASASLVKHIHDVTRRWMDPDGDGDPRDGIDGWRLDVPNEVPLPFWAEWRTLVKSINPEAYITGEIWDRADQWLDGRHFDAVMNYEFSRPAIYWICHKDKKLKPSEIDRRLHDLRLAYPQSATLVMQNLVDSHDTDRVVSMALNPDLEYDRMNRVQDNNPRYNNDKPPADCYAKARLVALLQMTYLGAPMVYYGDEVGMWGADDPTNRKPMLWEDLQPYEKPQENSVMKEHLEFYKKAIALRNAHPALRTGSFRTLLTDDAQDVWAFLRRDEKEQLIVVLNASNQPRAARVPLPDDAAKNWKPVFNVDAKIDASLKTLTVDVPAMAGVVLLADGG